MSNKIFCCHGTEFNIPDDETVQNHINDPTSSANIIIDQINNQRLYDKYLKGKKDLTILDLGANVGFFTIYAHDCAKSVISVEPTPSHQKVFEVLTQDLPNVKLVKAALAARDGDIQFYISDENSTVNSIENKTDKSITVNGLCLETLLRDVDKIDFCKIDIEGSEMQAVTLDTLKPVFDKIDSIFIEVHAVAPHNLHYVSGLKMMETLSRAGYTIELKKFNFDFFDTIYAYKD
jgi:FkbM family methyltransferase